MMKFEYDKMLHSYLSGLLCTHSMSTIEFCIQDSIMPFVIHHHEHDDYGTLRFLTAVLEENSLDRIYALIHEHEAKIHLAQATALRDYVASKAKKGMQ